MARRELSREELFALVWERPTSEIANELGISDVAVGKLCEKLQVPKPPRGYWARVVAGKAPRRPALKAFREEMEAKRKSALQAHTAGHFTELQSKFLSAALDELRKRGIEHQVDITRLKHISSLDQDVAAQALLLIQGQAQKWAESGRVAVRWGDVGQGKHRKTCRAIDAACPSAIAGFRDRRQAPFVLGCRSDCIRQMDGRTSDQDSNACANRTGSRS